METSGYCIESVVRQPSRRVRGNKVKDDPARASPDIGSLNSSFLPSSSSFFSRLRLTTSEVLVLLLPQRHPFFSFLLSFSQVSFSRPSHAGGAYMCANVPDSRPFSSMRSIPALRFVFDKCNLFVSSVIRYPSRETF